MFKNLLSNAIKFTDTGEIVFGMELIDGQYCFFVKDSGLGIPPAELPLIFKRFVKLEAENHVNHRGAGLGLYLCQQIITHLGGVIWATSELGKGTTIHFTLPGPIPVQ